METNNNNNNESGIEQPAAPKKPAAGKLWIVVVLLAGLVAGLILSDLATLPQQPRPFFLRDIPYFNPDPSILLHIVITTMEVAMLVALVIVYVKVFAETRAHFSLGLVVVLAALMLRTIFEYPLLLGTEGVILVPGLLTEVADFLTLGAYTLFLYLSLE